jgi:nucleotide-binding universal stress UspA family protein
MISVDAPAARENRHAQATPPRRLLVGVAFDQASSVALVRAHAIARRMELELLIVHVVAREPPSSVTSSAVVDLTSRRAREHLARTTVQDWAFFETGIALPRESIHVRFGRPAEQLARITRQRQPDLLVIGGRVESESQGRGVATAIVARSQCPVLVAGNPREDRTAVVGCDLASAEVPVVRVAAKLAQRLGLRVSVVHNLARTSLRGATYALPATLRAQARWLRMRALAGLVRDLAAVDDAVVTSEPVSADAILRMARARDADLIVLGTHHDMGLTTRMVLAEARRSVLVVPLP